MTIAPASKPPYTRNISMRQFYWTLKRRRVNSPSARYRVFLLRLPWGGVSRPFLRLSSRPP
jgi:hypothetical protein